MVICNSVPIVDDFHKLNIDRPCDSSLSVYRHCVPPLPLCVDFLLAFPDVVLLHHPGEDGGLPQRSGVAGHRLHPVHRSGENQRGERKREGEREISYSFVFRI